MKIVYLTAGAAGMYCGSCMHDNALAKAMIARGHDCILVPVYTPIRTDENDSSLDQVFMGGINLYLQQKLPWIAYLPAWMDAFLNRPALIRRLTAGAMTTDPRFLGALTVSMLHGMQGNLRKEVRRLCQWLVDDIRPETMILTNMLIAGCLPELKKRLSVSIWVTLQGDDIFVDSLPEPFKQQTIDAMRKLVRYVDGFIVHSLDYGRRMQQMLEFEDSRLHVTPLGIETRDLQSVRDAKLDRPPTVGYLARMAPEKGLHVLVDAFIEMHRRHPNSDSHLLMAGWMGPQHQDYWSQQIHKLTEAGLSGRWEYRGSVDRAGKLDFLSSIDLLCVPTTYQEPKGLFVLEAVACGIPYLQPDHGAFPELHDRLQFGSLFPVGDQNQLCQQMHTQLMTRAERLQERKARREALRAEVDIGVLADRTLALLR